MLTAFFIYDILYIERIQEEITMKELIVKVDGYKTVAHIFSFNEGLYTVTINGTITGIGGATLKGVIANTRRAIKRRG